jgi:putative aldouronate transport system substrate-binding protein
MVFILKKALLFVLAAAIAVVSGCSSKNDGKKEGGEPASVVWFVPGERKPDANAVIEKANEITLAKLNLKMDFQFIDSGAYTERMTMNMASGNAFDICFTGYINPYRSAVQNGGLLELDSLLKDAPGLYSAVSPYLWDAAKINGKIYAVPNEQIAASATALFIKKDLADKYGLDAPAIKKTSDIEPFLEKIKNNEPDIYPFRPNWGIRSFADMDEVTYYENVLGSDNGENPPVRVKIDGNSTEVIPITKDPAYYDCAAKLWDWFRKGYIRKDIASVMDEAQELKAGKFGVWLATDKPGVDVTTSESMGYQVITIPVSKAHLSSSSVIAAMTGIGRNSKNPKAAVSLLELVNTDKEFFNLLTLGIEGVQYEKAGGGAIRRLGTSNYAIAGWQLGNQFNSYLTEKQPPDLWEETKRVNEESVKSPLLGFAFDSSKVKNELSQCGTVIKQYAVAGNGSEDPQKYFEAFSKKLDEVGVNKIKEELERQIDEFLAEK